MKLADPDLWLAIACWTVIAVSCALVATFSFGRDQSIYAVVGDGLLHGQLPYRDRWDFKPPGIFFVYALAQAVFGKAMYAPRLLEAAGMVSLVLAFRSLARTFFGLPQIGLLGGAIATFILCQLDFWHSGQPETYGGFLTAWALVWAARTGSVRERALGWFGAGVLFGIAFLMKPPLGGAALVVAAWLARGERARDVPLARSLVPIVCVGAGSLLPLALCAAWFHARGAWADLSWTLFVFTPGYTKLGWGDWGAPFYFFYGFSELFTNFSAFTTFGVAAAIAFRPVHSREHEGLWLLVGVLCVHVAGIAMQAKFFAYHYGATLPLCALIAGLGLYKGWRRLIGQGPPGVAAFAGVIVLLAQMQYAIRDTPLGFWERSTRRVSYLSRGARASERPRLVKELDYVADYNLTGSLAAARAAAAQAPADRSIFVWGFEPVIYWAAERRPASRYVYDVAQRVSWEHDRARADLMAELRRDPPAVIVVQHGDYFRFVTGDDLDSARALAEFSELSELIEREYTRRERVEDFDLYVRDE